MKVDAMLRGNNPSEIAEDARARERAGFDGIWTTETNHDPFLPLVVAAEHTDRVQLGTAIAVAFARSPMTLAYTSHDLQVLSRGRFVLGLGSQVAAHVRHRFSMPWSHPARRMREYVQALRAIWAAWNTGEPLRFRGEFYSHVLMTPFFSPPPSPWGPPRVHLAAVGDQMTQVAGELCDGLLAHSFTTPTYLRERTLPALERGLREAGRTRGDVEVGLSVFVVTGRTSEELVQAARAVREQIAFYASTPSYRAVLELHGWSVLGEELSRLARSGEPDVWRRMGELIDDTVLEAFAVVAEPDRVGAAILERFSGLVDRLSILAPYPHDDELFAPAIDTLRAGHRSV